MRLKVKLLLNTPLGHRTSLAKTQWTLPGSSNRSAVAFIISDPSAHISANATVIQLPNTLSSSLSSLQNCPEMAVNMNSRDARLSVCSPLISDAGKAVTVSALQCPSARLTPPPCSFPDLLTALPNSSLAFLTYSLEGKYSGLSNQITVRCLEVRLSVVSTAFQTNPKGSQAPVASTDVRETV